MFLSAANTWDPKSRMSPDTTRTTSLEWREGSEESADAKPGGNDNNRAPRIGEGRFEHGRKKRSSKCEPLVHSGAIRGDFPRRLLVSPGRALRLCLRRSGEGKYVRRSSGMTLCSRRLRFH